MHAKGASFPIDPSASFLFDKHKIPEINIG
jgi:hypothetical protein